MEIDGRQGVCNWTYMRCPLICVGQGWRRDWHSKEKIARTRHKQDARPRVIFIKLQCRRPADIMPRSPDNQYKQIPTEIRGSKRRQERRKQNEQRTNTRDDIQQGHRTNLSILPTFALRVDQNWFESRKSLLSVLRCNFRLYETPRLLRPCVMLSLLNRVLMLELELLICEHRILGIIRS